MKSNTSQHSHEVVIKPPKGRLSINLKEIWRFKDLFYIFTWRDIKVRYKQTILGLAWVILQPLLTTGIFTIFFGRFVKIPSEDLPYSLFVLIGMVFWTLFSGSVTQASDSLIAHEQMIKKVYFPKIILPLGALVTSTIDFSINFLVLVLFSFIVKHPPQISIFYTLPSAIIITSISSIGFGLFLSALNVKFRDVRYALPFFIQILLFLTPIIYPLTIVSDIGKYLIALNPMTAVVNFIRFSFGASSHLDPLATTISILSAVSIFIFGIYYFKKTEKFFADII